MHVIGSLLSCHWAEMNETAGTPDHPYYDYFLLTTRVTSNTDKLLFKLRFILPLQSEAQEDALWDLEYTKNFEVVYSFDPL